MRNIMKGNHQAMVEITASTRALSGTLNEGLTGASTGALAETTTRTLFGVLHEALNEVSNVVLSGVIKVIGVVLIAVFLLMSALPVSAETLYKNSETGYQVDIDDEAGLLTDEDESALAEKMQALTAYGNIAFVSTDYNDSSTENYARAYFDDRYGTSSGSVFLVDMDNRYIYIFSRGFNYTIVTKSRAETITDNIYTMASAGDYYSCAAEAYAQMQTILEGGKIAQPMKYISNALLALILALLIFFFIVKRTASVRKASFNEMMKSADIHVETAVPAVRFTGQSKHYSPQKTDSGGGGGFSGGGGGGFSGGGGGGGGHRF